MKKEKLAFIGTGIIGAGLAVNAALRDFDVTLYDVVPVDAAKERVCSILDTLVEAGACTKEASDAAYERCAFTNDLGAAVADVVFVQECVPERMELKRDIYRKVQELAGNKPLIASSTSSFMPSELQEGALYPDRILVGHPYNPSYILPLIEIVGGKQTSQEAIDSAKELYTAIGKVPCHCRKEVFGYIVQNINFTLSEMTAKLVEDGVATAEDVDRALMYGPGMRLPITGHLLTISLGIDGGWKNIKPKYDNMPATEADLMVAAQIDEELANRPAELGNDIKSVTKFRDKMLVAMLKFQNML